ncbi:Rid family detoxifying hydrolase [Flavobacterium sp. NKUCC04_CG]|uniref:Rid family detoxifying hydrolase n=1 Tax=Flavobacterium sp. NKUCC04_CG TaxID=2842121 RepID=UPI001C5B07E9|nr:Rid family detoxifying hydrolase [Flavobacterium sp. NKUCC04_CG]MBW3517967.1 Rid family detoxifying hydrolase [Flavobacterium sp. NKUCC04_CG]
MKKIINSENAPSPIGPYNHAVSIGDFLFISGQIPFNQATQELISSSIEAETKQVMENLKAILTEAKMTFENAVKATIFIRNMDDFSRINEVYGSYFNTATAPARECVQVEKLPRNVNIEISMICSK